MGACVTVLFRKNNRHIANKPLKLLVIFFLTFSVQPRCRAAEGDFSMLQIMLTCTRTGKFVPTGIETDIDTFIALPEVLSLTRCPACGGNHYWTKS
jgi:hypothetical protein